MNIIDNITSKLGEDLKAEITKVSKLSVAASSFSIYAFEALKKSLIVNLQSLILYQSLLKPIRKTINNMVVNNSGGLHKSINNC